MPHTLGRRVLRDRDANERLIAAAAPDLLAACRIALDRADSWHLFHSGSEIRCDDLCAIRPQLKAAIYKAEGRK